MSGSVASREFFYSRWRIAMLLFGSLLFVAVGILFVVVPAGEISERWFGQFVGAMMAALFGAIAIQSFNELRNWRPVVRIGDDGIFDRRVCKKVIPWEAVVGLHLHAVKRDRFVGIEVDDAEAYQAESSFLERFFNRLNARPGKAPINIALNPLGAKVDDVVETLKRFRPVQLDVS